MAAQVALRRQQEVQLKRHLAQGLMRRGAAPPKAPSCVKKGVAQPGIHREYIWPGSGQEFWQGKHKWGIVPVLPLNWCVTFVKVFLLSGPYPPQLYNMIKCWEEAVRSVGRKGTKRDKISVWGWDRMAVRRKSSPKLSQFLTAGKENIAPQPQTPHRAVPLGLTPPGKVRRAWALREDPYLYPSPYPDPFLHTINTWLLSPVLTCCINLGKSLLIHGQNEGVGFNSPLGTEVLGSYPQHRTYPALD